MPDPSSNPPYHLTPFLTEDVIQRRVAELAEAINQHYGQCKRLILIGVLKGAVVFLADLARLLTVPCQIELVRLSSYEDQTQSSGRVKPVDLSLPDLSGAEVLVVEDILDTGLTLGFFCEYLRAIHRPKSLKTLVLLDKPSARMQTAEPFQADWVGFPVPSDFLVGYGLDYAELHRNLPYIARVDFE